MGKQKKVIVGVSGGVDSAVAAFLLKQQGFEVEGTTFRLWDTCDDSSIDDAKAVCNALGIPHHIFDFRKQFKHEVMDYFAREYECGVTPNPCVICNRTIKFGAFLEKARKTGADYISTGHYASIVYDESTGRFRVKKSACEKKDQSYVLYSLSQDQLGAALLPLCDYDKPEIRKIARENGLIVGDKAESQDICFIPDGDYATFLREYLGNDGKPGDFVDQNGNILGRHKGIRHYTIGQRKGLGLSFDRPMFVSDLSIRDNTVTIASNDALMHQKLIVTSLNWIDLDNPVAQVRVSAKIRYGAKPAAATVTPLSGSSAEVVFDEPQRAITPGQSVVFYDHEYLVGGGVISK